MARVLFAHVAPRGVDGGGGGEGTGVDGRLRFRVASGRGAGSALFQPRSPPSAAPMCALHSISAPLPVDHLVDHLWYLVVHVDDVLVAHDE